MSAYSTFQLRNVTVQHTSQQGTPVFNSQNLLNGDPKLDSQYRLLSGSDAIDQGAGSDYILAPGTLNFAAGETRREFTIAIVDDRLDETDEILNLALRAPTGGAVLGVPSRASLEIEDNDNERPYLPTLDK